MTDFRIDPGRKSRLEFHIVGTPREPRLERNGAQEDCYDNVRVTIDGKRVMDINPSGDCLATSWWEISLPDETGHTPEGLRFYHKVNDDILGDYERRCLGSLIQRMLDCEGELVAYLDTREETTG